MTAIKILKNFLNLPNFFLVKFFRKNYLKKENYNNSQSTVKTFSSLMLVYAKVFHKRTFPSLNQFCYDVFYICFDISKIKDLRANFFSLNRFNFFSFYEKDHGNRDGSNLENWIRKLLYEKNLNESIKKIFLFTHPRIFGYVFNPVNFWFCLDSENNLRAILFEVNNTFGQHHCYLVYNENHSIINLDQWFSCDKKFYVSPFFSIIGNYKFRVNFTPKKIAVWIDYEIDGKKNLFTNVISTAIVPLTKSSLIKVFGHIPFLTFKVIILIHWQALKLFFKKIKFVANPNKIPKNITTNHDKF